MCVLSTVRRNVPHVPRLQDATSVSTVELGANVVLTNDNPQSPSTSTPRTKPIRTAEPCRSVSFAPNSALTPGPDCHDGVNATLTPHLSCAFTWLASASTTITPSMIRLNIVDLLVRGDTRPRHTGSSNGRGWIERGASAVPRPK